MEQKIFSAMSAVMGDMKPIEKGKKNAQQGFNFRGIDDVYNVIQPLLARHKIFTTPEVVDDQREKGSTKSGGTLNYVRVKMRYTFWADDGSNVSCSVIGEAMDSGDKATNKAMSIAHKYALFQTFCIPTEGLDDPDAESHEMEHEERPRFAIIDMNAVRVTFDRCQTMDALQAAFKLVAVSGHPQLEEIVALKEAAKGRLQFVGDAPAPDEGPRTSNILNDGQRKALMASYKGKSREQRLADASNFLGRQVASFNELTFSEASDLLNALSEQQEA